MDESHKRLLGKIANTIRQLSIEAVEKANSGHPGLPMGCAEFAAYLWSHALQYNPKNPDWVNRDRFILSAGHGSMLLYSILYLTGYDLSLEDIKQFRQLHSKTPGHPESFMTPGVEATTGPLGQGVGNAVGEALAIKILSQKFNRDEYPLFTNKVYCLAGDGCMQEGVSSEVSSLAGHLALDNLVLIYDANNTTLDGPLSQSASENTLLRYKSYGFEVYNLNGYDFDQMDTLFSEIRMHQKKPVFIQMDTIIGKGSPHKANSYKAHGSPLGIDELKATKQALGLSEEAFFIPIQVHNFFDSKQQKNQAKEDSWNQLFAAWEEKYPELKNDFYAMKEKKLPDDLEEKLYQCMSTGAVAGRDASHMALGYLGKILPFLYGGSADLSSSDKTYMEAFPLITSKDFSGRNIKYGIREFGMATIASGLYRSGMITPFVGTFLTFSDYMKNGIRVATLSNYQVIYQFTHDSIFLGEDGPTHQPVEQLAALRSIPNIHVIRPADQWEVCGAWLAALNYQGTTAIILSRQKLPELQNTQISYREGVGRGAYILQKEIMGTPDFTLLATGSEVHLALDVAKVLENMGKIVRVISMPSWEIFSKQPEEYRRSVLGGDIGKRVSIEAASPFGWHGWVGLDGIIVSVDTFGASAPMDALQKEFGFTVEDILNRIL